MVKYRLSSCKGCAKKITKEEKHTYRQKTYCKPCYDKLHTDNIVKPRLSSCKGCAKKITKEEKHTYCQKTYCKPCYDKLHGDNEERKILLALVCDYYNIEIPTGFILKQIKDYKQEFKYTYSGMSYTLWYVKTVENKSFDDTKYGISYVKYYYEKAKLYYRQQQRIRESVNITQTKHIKTKQVVIDLSKTYQKTKEFIINLNQFIDRGVD